MTEYEKAELSGKIEAATSNALKAAQKRDWKKFDQHMETVSELRAALPIENDRTVGVVYLKDLLDEERNFIIRIAVGGNNLGLFIHREGEEHMLLGMIRFHWMDIKPH
jgi:hypothetical protein